MTARAGSLGGHSDLPEFLWGAEEVTETPLLTAESKPTTAGHVPGEVGLWVFVLGDMTVFAVLLVMLMRQRHTDPTVVGASATHLVPNLGFVNTLVLLLSSYLVVYAVHAHRRDAHRTAGRFIVAAIGCAAVFATVKSIEYGRAIGAGFTPTTNVFFNYYFALTGFHLLHVIIGSALLSWWWVKTRRRRAWSSSRLAVESIAVYWHMVDLLWIAIFTLTYLVCPQ
jgi:nitric oxide reductase NorE protein